MQSKKQSLIECTLNISSGLIISILLWYYIISPVFKIDSSIKDTILITAIFTVVSIVRSYMWRRLFNRRRRLFNRKIEVDFDALDRLTKEAGCWGYLEEGYNWNTLEETNGRNQKT